MFVYDYAPKNPRPASAREVAAQALEQEKKMALLRAEYKAEARQASGIERILLNFLSILH